MGIFEKIINKFRNKDSEEEKYLKIAKEHIDKAGENLTKEQINEMMKLGMDIRELYPEVSKLYFERIEDYFPHASTMLATFYMDKDDEMYEKYCLKAANQGENIAKKSLAIFYAKNNNEEKMLEWYNKLENKEDYDVLAYMSNYYMFQDNYDKVKEINFTILKNKKNDKYAPNCLGDAYFAEDDFENSEKYYKIALENGSPDSKDKLFNLYQTTENIEKFRELIEKDGTKKREDFLTLGNLYFHKKDYKMAEKWYLESEKLGFLESKYNLGHVYYEIENFEKAEKYFQEVIEKIPHLKENAIEKLINVYNSQANLYLTSGDFDKAEKYLKILVEKYSIKECYYNLAVINRQKGNIEKYKEYILKGIELGDSQCMFSYALSVYSETGKYTEEVDRWLKKAAEKDHVDAMYELGLFASEQNRIEDSKKWYKKAAEKGETTAMNNLANIYSDEGNKEEAMKLYLESAEKGNPLAFFNLGNYYEENNNIELAKEYYSKVLDSLKGYPTSKLEQEAVNRLKKLQSGENN
ncbi:tetratricopeptide repeat protein [Leptotrichia sp. oral taxon 212]|uniref:SEL1-like repeat protein n=1 Tax=Leptotrichia sp. oral taxon 212 TaxID=712357 RepID=UPI0006A969EA|nr:tetratricopeptide repeat protein [Leptotrichia sp. oral taxon 212]ALA95871.1 hypothetical protein AMK43_07425 [Leptotrichia sp. oral taxon 212]